MFIPMFTNFKNLLDKKYGEKLYFSNKKNYYIV